MKTIVLLIVIATSVVGVVLAETPLLFHPGTGAPNPGQGDSRAMWSEPPDLNGVVWSSEQILEFGMETEIANDFIPTETMITHATWWGGFYNNATPCESGMTTPGFNLEFFDNDNCFPGQIVAYIAVTDFTEESVGCQVGTYPLFRYGADVSVGVNANSHYWFCAQMRDHHFPPEWGRLNALHGTECIGALRSAYYGFPDWTLACEIDICIDASQEFDGDHSEACCFSDGHCEFILTGECAAHGGVSQGQGTVCDPNPCQATPTRRGSWGAVRALFR